MTCLKMFFFSFVICVTLVQCVQKGVVSDKVAVNHKSLNLKFLSEYILPPNAQFQGTTIGGLSSIDYHEGVFYLICDDKKSPRFYKMTCDINDSGISNVNFIKVVFFTNENQKSFDTEVDPEALRFDESTSNFYWASEGKINKDVPPELIECTAEGQTLRSLTLPSWSKSQKEKKWGPRDNEAIESLSISNDGKFIWVAQESPLKQDGKKPTHKSDIYPIRFSKISKESFLLDAEYVYQLDSIARPKIKKGDKGLNGLAEIMCYDDNSFLTIERSYVSGYDDGGNDVKIYQTFIGGATDVSSIKSLKESVYRPMIKRLVVDFNEIKHTFPNGFVDNIEGICFGPTLPNGNKTVLVVSDDNFGKYGPQANQLIVFEVIS